MRSHNALVAIFGIVHGLFACCMAVAAEGPAIDKTALNGAFEALKSFDSGQDMKLLKPIDDAALAAHDDAAVRKDLEMRLSALLPTEAPRVAKDYICRKLMVVGTAESVPALAALLADKELSHMSRYALERMPAAEAAQALRDTLPKVNGALKVGVIGSLGVRRDAASVASLAASLGDADKSIAGAAACALGNIGNVEAANALLESAKKPPEGVKAAIADASLACAERMLAEGKKAEAIKLYKAFTGEQQPKNIRLAAMRGLLAASGKKD